MEFADTLGFDGVCLNEHHQTAYGMMPIPGVLAGALARSVKRAKLAILGRALPLLNNPLMVAEEYAMLDNLTRGRFVAGFVRGIGAEYHAMGINPVYSQERFAEAHDLIVRAWTEPGPFAYEGKHYQFNYVNPWPRPYQTPHPPIWMPSQGSPRARSSGRRRCATPMRRRFRRSRWWRGSSRCIATRPRRPATRPPPTSSPGRTRSTWPRPTRRRCARRSRISKRWSTASSRCRSRCCLPPGYTNIDSMKRVRAAKVTGKTSSIEELNKTGVVIVGSPNTVREKLAEYQDLAGFNTSLTKTQFGTLPDDMTAPT